MLFGDKVKRLRENAGMTQAELGKLVGVSDRVLGYYESNERFPRKPEIISKLAAALEVSADYLVGNDGYFVQKADEKYGYLGHKQAQSLLKNAEILFAGGELIDSDKDIIHEILSELYFDAKKKNREKYCRK